MLSEKIRNQAIKFHQLRSDGISNDSRNDSELKAQGPRNFLVFGFCLKPISQTLIELESQALRYELINESLHSQSV